MNNNDASDEAARAIRVAKAALPDLTAFGAYDAAGRASLASIPEFDPACLEFSLDGVATAIAFLRQCGKAKRPRLLSYDLKHAAEAWGGRNGMAPYVKNGELIAAAIYLGFDVERESKGHNVRIAVDVKDVRRIDPRNALW